MTTNSEPPFLTIGTAVSAKCRGAFCEATVKKIVKSVKCRVFLKESQSNLLITDEYITGPLEIGATVEVKHPDTLRMMEATIKQINDSSMYTVVFNDNDECTLRRSQLCLKGDKHFVESETLDNLPLSNPEHFGSPVIACGKHSRSSVGTGSNQGDGESEEDEVEEESARKTYSGKSQELVGKLMLYESNDRKKSLKVPVLVVLPDASSMELNSKDHVLVRSFKDNKFLSVAKKDVVPFSRETALKNEEKSLKPAMEKALLFVDNRELPQSWNREELLGVDEGHQEVEMESDDDEEQTEEKDRFVAQLYKFSDDRGTPINKGPSIGSKDLNLYRLFKIVKKLGGYNRVTNQMRWRLVYSKMLLPPCNTASTQIKNAYKKYLHAFEDFDRKLGSSMGTVSRPSQNRNDTGRGLVAFMARDLAKNLDKGDSEKEKLSEASQSEVGSAAESMLPKQVTLKRKKSARNKAVVIKELTEEKPKEKSAATDVKKEDILKDIKAVEERKEIKKVENFPKKSLVKKVLVDTKEAKLAKETKEVTCVGDKIEKRVLKKKEVGSIKEKREIQEKLKEPQKRQRRSAIKLEVNVDSKKEKIKDVKDKKEELKQRMEEVINDMEEREKDDIGKDKDELKIEEVLKKEEITVAEEEIIVKVEERGDNKDIIKDTQDDKLEKRRIKKAKFDEIGASNAQNIENLPIGARLRVRYGKGKNAIQYDAKILEIGMDPGPRQYLVHYQGWNNRHDEWIKTDRIVKVLVKPSLSGGKKTHGCKQLPTPGRKVFKKKATFDKPPMLPLSLKSESSSSQGLGQQGEKSNKSSPAASTSKLRSTRANSIDLNMNTLPGSESEASDSSDNDSKPRKKLDKPDEMESSIKSCNMLPESESKTQKMEAHDVDSSIDLVAPSLIKVDDTEKGKIFSKETIANKEENDVKMEVMLESIDHVLMKEDTDRYSDPILQKIETNFNLSKLKSACDIEVKKVIESDKKENEKKEILRLGRKPFINVDKLELNTECVKKVEKIQKDKKTVSKDDEKLEESQYDFKVEPEIETGIKSQEKKTVAVAEIKDDGEKEVKPEPVMDVPTIVRNSKDDLGKDLLAKPSLTNENEIAKSDSEGDKRGKEKRISSTKIDIIESKKAKVDTIEKSVCHVENTLPGSPEKKIFVMLAEKKQGFSPFVRKLIPSPEKCVEIQYGKFESVPEECEKKRNETKEEKNVVEMVVVHKVSPVKKDIVIEKRVEVYVENGSVVKNNFCNEDNVVVNENNEASSVASVRRKIRKKTKKKLEMEEIEAVTVLRKMAKHRLRTRKTKEITNKETERTIKMDAVEIDLHCDEQIRSRSASPERLSSSQSYIQESQGLVPHNETIDCHVGNCQCSMSYISKHNIANNSQSSVNKSNAFENTPPSSPEHDSDVSHPNNQHNPIEASIQTSNGGSSKTVNSQPAGRESPDGNASTSNHSSGSSSSSIVAGSEGSDHVPVFSGKRKQASENPAPTKRRKRSSRGKSCSSRIQQFGESDIEDTNMLLKSRSPQCCSNSHPQAITASRSPRPPKYNFNLEDGQYLEGTARILFLVQKIMDIRKLYMNIKSEVAGIDRRQKKLKRKEKNREPQNSSTVLQMECS